MSKPLPDLTDYPKIATACTANDIETWEDLELVLRDSVSAAVLGLNALALAKARALLGLSGETPTQAPVPDMAQAPVVTIQTHDDLPLEHLLNAVLVYEPSGSVFMAALRRIPKVAVTGVDGRQQANYTQVDKPKTLAMLRELAGTPPSSWPATYQGAAVVPLADMFPTRRQRYCPHTGELLVDYRAAHSGHNYTGLSDEELGLLTFLAEQRSLVSALGSWRAVLSTLALARQGGKLDPAFDLPMAVWNSLPESKRTEYRERVFVNPADRAFGVPRAQAEVLESLPEGAHLDTVLCRVFRVDELRRIVSRHSELARLEGSLPWGGSPANFAWELVRLAKAHGVVGVLVEAAVAEAPMQKFMLRSAKR